MQARTDPDPNKRKHTPSRNPHRPLLTGLAASFLATFAFSNNTEAAAIIYSGGEPGSTHSFSDSSVITDSDGVVFQIGVFYGIFVPTAENTDQWEENWRVLEDAAGQPLDGSTTPLHTINSVFDDFMGFTDEVEITHNNSPFVAGKQGYLWGYDTRVGPQAEWFLVTNEDWLLPSGSGVVPTATWSVTDANGTQVVLGSLAGADMTFEAVSVMPAAVPEPSAAALAALAGALALRRRRPRTMSPLP